MATKPLPPKAPAKESRKTAAPAGGAAKPSISQGVTSVREIRERLGLTQNVFARLSGLSVRTIAEWESGKTPAAAKAQRMIEIQRLQRALTGVMRADYIGTWLQAPNEAFSSLKPIEVIERGEVDRIWRMIYELESGIPT